MELCKMSVLIDPKCNINFKIMALITLNESVTF